MNKQNNIKLYDFLEEFRCNPGDKITHTSLDNPKGSFNITGLQRRNKFYELYKSALNMGAKLHITECHREQGPIMIDIDLNYESEDHERRYTDDHIIKIITNYNILINKYLDLATENTDGSDKLQAFIFEKPTPTIKNNDSNLIKDGFHIMYPFVCTEPNVQFLMRHEIIEICNNEKWFDDISPSNTNDQIFDKAVIKDNNWFLYGSSKPNRDPYTLTKAFYQCEGEVIEFDIENMYDENNFPELFSIRRTSCDEICPFNDNYTKDSIENICLELGLIKSDKPVAIKRSTKNNIEEVRIARKLVQILSIKRAVNYDDWLQLGWCLHNINDGLLNDWIDFSKKAKHKFKPGECEKMWAKFRDDGFTMASLYYWAKEDNPDEFVKIKIEEISDKIENGASGTPWDTAKVVYEQYKHTFVCTSVKNKKWYEFKDHRWQVVDEAYSLNYKLSEEVVNVYTNMSSWFGNIARDKKGGEKDTYLAKANSASTIALKLRQSRYKKDVLAECMTLFYNPTFVEKLDENRNLLGFNNGVYDLENQVFRCGRPDDYISMSTGIDYVPYDPSDPITIEVEKFLRDIQPESDLQNYVLNLLASCLQGHIPDEKFHIWTGTGGNGKSLLVTLFMKALGEYAMTLPTSLITGKRGASNAASPELVKTKGKRFCILQEPEASDHINLGLMKELTGGDKIYGRGLFADPIEFLPQFKLILTCNKLPLISSDDGGTWRRIRLIHFMMKFVDNPKEKFERKIDRTIKNKLDTWKTAMMSILIKQFKDYKLNGLQEPMQVKLATSKYQADSDVILEYITNSIVITENDKDLLKLNQIYEHFKTWFRAEFGNTKKVPLRNEIRTYFENKFSGNTTKVGWKRMKIKYEEDEEEQVEEQKISINDIATPIDASSKPKKMNKLDA